MACLQAALDILLYAVGVRRVQSYHDPANPNSGRVMRHCGMSCEDTLRGAVRSNQGVTDACLYGLLAGDRRGA